MATAGNFPHNPTFLPCIDCVFGGKVLAATCANWLYCSGRAWTELPGNLACYCCCWRVGVWSSFSLLYIRFCHNLPGVDVAGCYGTG